MKIINLGMLLLVTFLSIPGQVSLFIDNGWRDAKDLPIPHSFPAMKWIRVVGTVAAPDITAEEDLPFDNTTWGGYIMNWITRLLLWFIYLTVILMILAGTLWFLTSRGFWSWVLCMIGAFFYAMLLGRYWGYTACLVGFVILFSVMKLFLTSGWGMKKLDRFNNSGLNKRMRKVSGKYARKKGDTAP
jgi:hypothetical protein